MIIDYEKSNTYKVFIILEKGENYPETIKYFVKRENKNRIFKKCVCDTCSKIYYRRKYTDSLKYCSDFCRYPLIIIKCFNCGKERKIEKYKFEHSRNNIFFCSRKCKDFAQSVDGNCEEIRPSHFGNGIRFYREKALKNKEIKCEECGLDEEDILTVHHRDENRKNNLLENLAILCPNCHARYTKRKQRTSTFRK